MADDRWRYESNRDWREDRGSRRDARPHRRNRESCDRSYPYGRFGNDHGEPYPRYGSSFTEDRNDEGRGYGSPYRPGYGEYDSGYGHGAGYGGGRAPSYGSAYGQGYRSPYGRRSPAYEPADWRDDHDDDRNWWDRTKDQFRAWGGDDDARRRRELDEIQHNRGRGPRGYTRSDDRIREDVSDRLSDDWRVDASDIEVAVAAGEVTLTGTVNNREDKRRAEDIADDCSGVKHVQNNLRVQDRRARSTAYGAVAAPEAVREVTDGK